MSKATKIARAEFGSVSCGTLRPEDLIPAFADVLESLDANGAYAALVREAGESMDIDAQDSILDDLRDALESFAPPYGYFGTLEGDGADFGFWPSHDAVQDAIHDKTAIKVDDMGDVPKGYTGDVFHVSDHGNLTYYVAKRGKCREVWGIV